VKAEATAAELRAIADPTERMEAFAARAAIDGTDSTAQTGGDLGFFARGDMVPEFADALFDAVDPQQGDIIGPVQSEFGWHVIMFNEARAPLPERLEAAQTALAADGANFATVAAEHSDGAEAADGGETGWHVVEDLDPASQLALEVVEVGQTTEPVATDAGWVIYQKLEEASRPLEGEAALRKAATAFDDWYQELRFDAEDAGEISIDDSVSAESDPAALGA
jgi:parvulin-like peptidyl-prolyl isomerase